MKELSIKEKAKAYDKAIELIKKCATDKYGCVIGIKPSDIFSELKESEDERIRKELIRETKGSEIKLFEAVTNEEFVAWLERQREQKPTRWSEEDERILAKIIEKLDISKNINHYEYSNFEIWLTELKEKLTK